MIAIAAPLLLAEVLHPLHAPRRAPLERLVGALLDHRAAHVLVEVSGIDVARAVLVADVRDLAHERHVLDERVTRTYCPSSTLAPTLTASSASARRRPFSLIDETISIGESTKRCKSGALLVRDGDAAERRHRHRRGVPPGAAVAHLAARSRGRLPGVPALAHGHADGLRRGRGALGADARRRAARRPRGPRGASVRRARRAGCSTRRSRRRASTARAPTSRTSSSTSSGRRAASGRIHAKPAWSEIAACRPWLDAELEVVKPDVLVCLGATAAQALLGRSFRVTRERGKPVDSDLAPHVLATIHPSAILRADAETRESRARGTRRRPRGRRVAASGIVGRSHPSARHPCTPRAPRASSARAVAAVPRTARSGSSSSSARRARGRRSSAARSARSPASSTSAR